MVHEPPYAGRLQVVEKRLLLFMVLSTSVLVGFSLLNAWLIGPPVQEIARPSEEEQEDPDDPPRRADGEIDAPETPDPDAPPSEDRDARDVADAEPTDPSDSPDEESLEPTVPEVVMESQAPVWAALGSYQPDESTKLLVVLNNAGAAVERIELVERNRRGGFRFREIENKSGYLGYLALTNTPDGGCQVNLVPDGSPAAEARADRSEVPPGLRVGDRIVSANGRDIRSREGLHGLIQRTRPGQNITLEVLRGESETPERFTAVLSERPLVLLGSESPESNGPGPNPPSFRMGLGTALVRQAEDVVRDPGLAEWNWEVSSADKRQIEFRFVAPAIARSGGETTGQLEYIKRYVLGDTTPRGDAPALPGYHFDLEVEIRNLSETPQQLAYQLEGPNGLTTEGWWFSTKIHPSFFRTAGARDVIWNAIGTGHQIRGASEVFKQANSATPDRPLFSASAAGDARELRYIGIDTQYFSVAMMSADYVLPEARAQSAGNGGNNGNREVTMMIDEVIPLAVGDFGALSKNRVRLTNVSYVMTGNIREIQPQENLSSRYLIFAGPKDTDVLYEYRLSDVMYYGWFPWVAKPLARVLHFFYWIVGNYGVAIILLTVLVRGCMFPLSRKAAQNAAMMQELAPEIKRISEKYKTDMDKRVKAQRELYAKYNFNPFSGCLLVFLQLPIFIGLYRCLSVDIELRQAPLIPGIEWASNLAGPDKLWRWPLPNFLADETGFLGPYLNILPVITVVLFLVQQKLFTPPAVDEQTRMQQQMMKYMMIFIGVLFFKVPAGLCIYFISSSIWGIAERLMLPKPKPKQGDGGVSTSSPKGKPPEKPGGKPGGKSDRPTKGRPQRRLKKKR
jgi:YidC/Oxa1 family membrane protein insertase